MTPVAVPAKLLGGPFDGDKSGMILPLPPTLYVWACKTPPKFCPSSGVHWDRTLTMDSSEVYHLGPLEGGVQIYVYEDLELQSPDKRSEETPAPRDPVAP